MKKTIRLSRVMENIFFSVYFFFALFTPAIPISTTKVLLVANVMLIFWCALTSSQMSVPKKLLKMFLVFMPFLFFFLFMQCLHFFFDGWTIFIYRLTILQTLLPVAYIFLLLVSTVAICERFAMDLNRYLHLMVYATVLQLFCVLLSLAIPSVRDMFITLTLRYTQSDVMINAFNTMGSKRGYGFSANLFDAFGYIVAMLISFTFLLGLETKKKRLILLAFVMLIMPALNARTGLLLSLMGLSVVFCFYLNRKHIPLYIVGALALVICIVFVYQRFVPEVSKQWLILGVEQTNALLHGRVIGVYGQILGEDLVWPPRMILGEGASPEFLEGYIGIDSGYIQYLWRFGVIGSVCLLAAQFLLFAVAWRSNKRRAARCILAIFPVMILTYLFKLYSWGNLGAAFILFSLPAVIVVDGQRARRRADRNFLRGGDYGQYALNQRDYADV